MKYLKCFDEILRKDKTIRSLHKRWLKKANRIEYGRNRIVYIFTTYVIKLPTCLDGFSDNDWEGSISNANDDPEEIRYARTRLIYKNEIPILYMEYVVYACEKTITKRLGYYPYWVNSVDCGQVGFNKKGKLVAFDYGCR